MNLRTWSRKLSRAPVFYLSLILLIFIINAVVGTVLVFSHTVLHPEIVGAHSSNLLALHWHTDRPLSSSIMRGSSGYDENAAFPVRTYESLKESCHNCAEVAASTPLGVGKEKVELEIGSKTFHLVGEAVTPDYFEAIGVKSETREPLRLTFAPGEAPPIVISDRLWDLAFQRSDSAVGAVVQLDHVPFVVVGIADKLFMGISQGRPVQFWIPLKASGADAVEFDPLVWSLNILVLPKEEKNSRDVATGEITHLAKVSLLPPKVANAPNSPLIGVEVESGASGFGILRKVMRPFAVTLILVVFLLSLTAFVSLVLLIFVRVTNDQRSTAIRLALGGHPARIVADFATEMVLLFLIGSTAGLVTGSSLGHLLSALVSQSLRPVGLFVPWQPVSIATIAIAILVNAAIAALLGFLMLFLLPSEKLVLRGQGTFGLAKVDIAYLRRLTSVVMLVELVLTLSTLNASFLLIRNARNLLSAPLGFSPENLVLASVLPGTTSSSVDQTLKLRSLYENMLTPLRREYGSTNVSISSLTPVSSWTTISLPFSWEGATPGADTEKPVPVNFVGGEFFSTMRIPIILGRGPSEEDISKGFEYAVISRKVARERYGNRNPVGYHIQFQESAFEVIGVAGDVAYLDPRIPIDGSVYLPYSNFVNIAVSLPDALNIEVRSTMRPEDVSTTIRRTVTAVNPSAQIGEVRTEVQQIDDDFSEERIAAVLAGITTIVLLLLAMVAVYGIVAQGVSQRTQEIAVRLTLGASNENIAIRFIRELLTLEVIALAIVIPIMIATYRLVRHSEYSQLVDALRSFDVWSSAAVAMTSVFIFSLLGAALPVIRTLRISPSNVLRAQ